MPHIFYGADCGVLKSEAVSWEAVMEYFRDHMKWKTPQQATLYRMTPVTSEARFNLNEKLAVILPGSFMNGSEISRISQIQNLLIVQQKRQEELIFEMDKENADIRKEYNNRKVEMETCNKLLVEDLERCKQELVSLQRDLYSSLKAAHSLSPLETRAPVEEFLHSPIKSGSLQPYSAGSFISSGTPRDSAGRTPSPLRPSTQCAIPKLNLRGVKETGTSMRDIQRQANMSPFPLCSTNGPSLMAPIFLEGEHIRPSTSPTFVECNGGISARTPRKPDSAPTLFVDSDPPLDRPAYEVPVGGLSEIAVGLPSVKVPELLISPRQNSLCSGSGSIPRRGARESSSTRFTATETTTFKKLEYRQMNHTAAEKGASVPPVRQKCVGIPTPTRPATYVRGQRLEDLQTTDSVKIRQTAVPSNVTSSRTFFPSNKIRQDPAPTKGFSATPSLANLMQFAGYFASQGPLMHATAHSREPLPINSSALRFAPAGRAGSFETIYQPVTSQDTQLLMGNPSLSSHYIPDTIAHSSSESVARSKMMAMTDSPYRAIASSSNGRVFQLPVCGGASNYSNSYPISPVSSLASHTPSNTIVGTRFPMYMGYSQVAAAPTQTRSQRSLQGLQLQTIVRPSKC